MATNGTTVGVFTSTTTGTAAQIVAGAWPVNPQSLDIVQVINEGGKCVWNFSAAGVANVNPASPTTGPNGEPLALQAQRFGANLAAAFGAGSGASNAQNPLDILQIQARQGGGLLLHITSLGVVTTP